MDVITITAIEAAGAPAEEPIPRGGAGAAIERLIENQQRAAVIAEARSWLGTPYHHQADVKGHGADCAMLLVRVFVDCGLTPVFDPRPYPVDWHLHRDEERYLNFLGTRARAVEAPKPGDVVLFKYGRCFSHGGIVLAWPRIVHAYHPARIVEEHNITAGPLARRETVFFSHWA